MPFKDREDLPESVAKALRQVPHAQSIYKEAFNNAYKEYKRSDEREGGRSREETAHAVAWSAVKHKYEKGEDGAWHPKD